MSEDLKRAAAELAVERYVESGTVVGLGPAGYRYALDFALDRLAA